eukprot:2780757-Pyramimonas_sp.AAC.1
MVWMHDGGACHGYMKVRQLVGSVPACLLVPASMGGGCVCRGPSMAKSRACEAHMLSLGLIGSLWCGYMTEGLYGACHGYMTLPHLMGLFLLTSLWPDSGHLLMTCHHASLDHPKP